MTPLFEREGRDERWGEQVMVRQYYTFLIFPGAHGKLRQIQLPSYVVQLILGFALAGVMTLGVMANSYAHMLLKVSDFNTLRTERESLKTHCYNLEEYGHSDA